MKVRSILAQQARLVTQAHQLLYNHHSPFQEFCLLNVSQSYNCSQTSKLSSKTKNRPLKKLPAYIFTTKPNSMSPRNDTYLSMCLAQAELSPLHYRHGAIIVRGGKIIGQGFNTHRPGFDGGALKTGVLPSSTNGPAIEELKQRMKSKPKPKSKQEPDNLQKSSFTPFETIGNGHNANVALSLHSEMMAIQSALSLSSGAQSAQTSARGAKCFEKPCFSLSGDSKKRKLRADVLKKYAEAVFEECGGEGSVQKSRFEPGACQPGFQVHVQCVQRQGERQRVPSEGEGETEGETPTEEEREREVRGWSLLSRNEGGLLLSV